MSRVGTRRADGASAANENGWRVLDLRGRSSTRGGVGHARLQPTLCDCKEPGRFARGEGLVEAKDPAIAPVALGTLDREGGTKATTRGLVCRGRNDVLAHGNTDFWNLVHSGSQACVNLREPIRKSVGCSSTDPPGDEVAKQPARDGGLLRAGTAKSPPFKPRGRNKSIISKIDL